MRVFISHSSKDKPAVEALALALRERGIEPWLDKWEIGPGDDIVASINAGLEEASAGVIVFSQHSKESRWVEAEVSYLTYARVQESKALIPVIIGEDIWVPPLLRPLARRGIEEIDAIADALLHRKAKPSPVRAPEHGRVERVLITLLREAAGGIRTAVAIADQEHGAASWPELPPALLEAQAAFLQGFRVGRHRFADAEADIAELGRTLRAFCLPGDTAEALADLVDGSRVGTTIEVCFEAEDADLLGLPFEALLLPDDRLLATHPSVVMFRRPAGLKGGDEQPLAGPLKILVAVGAPDEGQTRSVVLDQERELQSILDAVEPAQRHENISVRILEVGHPDLIGEAVEADAYHVLHLSCHGKPGELELEDEEGRAAPTTAPKLLEPIRAPADRCRWSSSMPAMAAFRSGRRRASPTSCCAPGCRACSPCRPRSATSTPPSSPAPSTSTWCAASRRWRAARWQKRGKSSSAPASQLSSAARPWARCSPSTPRQASTWRARSARSRTSRWTSSRCEPGRSLRSPARYRNCASTI